ncbi:MAG: DNA translocase FtsK [Chloroflexi bacterium]|nr:DNA translocase FtsK [Chloroflexota bacterium]
MEGDEGSEAHLPPSQPIQSTLLPLVATGETEAEGEESLAPAEPVWNRWELPALDLLEQAQEAEPLDQTQRARQIEEALASYGVEGKVVQIHVGPAVTQFGVEPGWDRRFREVKERDPAGRIKLDKDGNAKARLEEVSRTRVKVERITGLANNLAMALAAPSVRIEAPVPGKQMVGIEVPNHVPSLVALRSVIESPGFQRLRSRSKLALALGKGVSGDAVVADLARMPHLLIAGATGSGKSVCINSIICCLLMHASPEDVRVLMVDPKRVELVPYNPIPHLLGPVIVDADKVVGTLHWVLKEMDGRYRKFASAGVRNIEGYNRSPKLKERMPYWVLVIDELADLMMVAPYEVERGLCRLAQLARATGIHLVVATQRPSVDVVTGLIKANFPTRISFAVTSHIDSRTILDSSGAEKLLGRGDMLYMPTDAAKPKRVQGAFVSDDEVERLVQFWGSERFRLLRPAQFAEEMELATVTPTGAQEDEPDALLERARELAESSERISASFLQRRLRIGYPRAARLMEVLRDEGYGEPGALDDGY